MNDGNGVVFQITPNFGGGVTETIIHTFAPCSADKGCLDGVGPRGGLGIDFDFNLYGTTMTGGAASTVCGETDMQKPIGCGTVFKLAPNDDGPWNETILARFKGGADNMLPAPDRLWVEFKGGVIGTAPEGGSFDSAGCSAGCGTAWRIKR